MSFLQKPPLTNLQLELLKVFSRSVPDDDLRAIKQLITDCFAHKASSLADEVWDDSGFTEETMQQWRQTHLRTPYYPANHIPPSIDPV